MAKKQNVEERRGTDRIPLQGSVSVRVLEGEILGPSRNVSPDGIYFIAAAELPVEVTIPGLDERLRGKIVRIGAVRDGELGIAIRFDEKVPAEQLPKLRD